MLRESANRLTALIVGACFLIIGALGFTANPTDWLFGILSVNVAANVLHLGVGVLLIAVAFSPRAPLLDAIAGTLLLALGIAGLFIITTPANVIAVNGAANLLHFASAAVLLAVGLGARR